MKPVVGRHIRCEAMTIGLDRLTYVLAPEAVTFTHVYRPYSHPKGVD